MPQYDDSACSCPRVTYIEFDSICRQEIQGSICADAIINRSTFCTAFQLDMLPDPDSMMLRDHLYGLNKRVGLYQVWAEEAYCYEHDRYSMLGVYVGKGEALGRVLEHAKSRLPGDEFLSVSFFECENRIAKYLEQLFLDIYQFELNKNENPGDQYLYACWDSERRTNGTELHSIANRVNDNRKD